MPRPSSHLIHLSVAALFAKRSTCPRREVGCVLVDTHGRVLSTGYNGVASGRPHCNEGHPCPGVGADSGTKLDACEAIHAEQNAIILLPDPFTVQTAYVTAFPCASCIKLLLGTSCELIVYRDEYTHPESRRWWEEAGRGVLRIRPQDLEGLQ